MSRISVRHLLRFHSSAFVSRGRKMNGFPSSPAPRPSYPSVCCYSAALQREKTDLYSMANFPFDSHPSLDSKKAFVRRYLDAEMMKEQSKDLKRYVCVCACARARVFL